MVKMHSKGLFQPLLKVNERMSNIRNKSKIDIIREDLVNEENSDLHPYDIAAKALGQPTIATLKKKRRILFNLEDE